MQVVGKKRSDTSGLMEVSQGMKQDYLKKKE